MARKKKSEELADILEKNNAYTYRVDMGSYNLRYTILSLTENEASKKVAELHPGKPVTYLSQANRIIIL
jgi:hypothetical protein